MSYEAYPSSLVNYHYGFRLTFVFITDSACAGAGTYTEYFCENSPLPSMTALCHGRVWPEAAYKKKFCAVLSVLCGCASIRIVL